MKPFKQAMAKALKGEMEEDCLSMLPAGFQTIGTVAVLNLKPELKKHKEQIGRSMLELFPRLKTVCIKVDGVKGNERLPSIEKVAGNGTETVHRENGCLYRLDVTKVMFSKGNVNERGRIARLIKNGETVVDMFCGVGYFSIPIAKAGKAAKIYALDINPAAVHYLKENIRLNKISNIKPIECDNRNAPARLLGIADRVLMGYLHGTDKFLDAAFGFLKKEGGIIHFHDIYKDYELWGKPLGILESYAAKYKMRTKVLEKHVVKSYSPKTRHAVIDAELKPPS